MQIKTIQLNEEQLKVLDAFLARVDLKGSEVNAFNNIVNTIFGQTPPAQLALPEAKVIEKAEVEKVDEAKE